ncbi:MAG: alpha-glucosidase [Anaerolineales bacterium]
MSELKWWQKAVFYQIYPRSFADGNGDGIGDFIGMAEKLDYLKDLGIDAIWLSPHFPSPQFDVGYDISDYVNVAPEYGTLEDFKRFLDGAHERGIRVILDWVLNHTSHLHQWFLDSRSSRDNPKRDWYIWKDGKNGGPPNNWLSPFGGSAWEYDEATDQYYYHYFLKEQPDLNWRNPEVKQAMWDATRFWLDLGVDGYRLDAIGTIFERPDMPEHPGELTDELRRALHHGFPDGSDKKVSAAWEKIYQYQHEQPGVHELMQELRQVINEYPDRMLVGENSDISYHGDGDNELHMVFNFPLMRTKRLTPAWVRANQKERLATLPPGAWPCNTLNNHDTPRLRTKFGDGKNDEAIARTSLALMLTLRGTPFIYNGEEIGMPDYYLTDINLFVDPPSISFYHQEIEKGIAPAEALIRAAHDSRDRCRTPLQWRNAPNAGFSPEGVRTWLPVNPNYAQGLNVADQQDDPKSMLNFYKKMLQVRRENPALVFGEYQPLHESSEKYLAFLRQSTSPQQTCLVVINFSEEPQKIDFELNANALQCVYSTHRTGNEILSPNNLMIEPFEILIIELTSS